MQIGDESTSRSSVKGSTVIYGIASSDLHSFTEFPARQFRFPLFHWHFLSFYITYPHTPSGGDGSKLYANTMAHQQNPLKV